MLNNSGEIDCALYVFGMGLHAVQASTMCDACVQMERRARLRKIMATMDDEDERKAALPGQFALQSILYITVSLLLALSWLADIWPCMGLSNQD